MSLEKKIRRMKRFCKMVDRYKLEHDLTQMPFETNEDIRTYYEHISYDELEERYRDIFGSIVLEETLNDDSENLPNFSKVELTPSKRLKHKIVGHLKANGYKVNHSNLELLTEEIESMMVNMFEENAHENIELIIEGISHLLR